MKCLHTSLQISWVRGLVLLIESAGINGPTAWGFMRQNLCWIRSQTSSSFGFLKRVEYLEIGLPL